MVYDIKVTEEMLEENRNAKFILIHSISPKLKEKINFNLYTSHEIWNILKSTYEKNERERKSDIKKRIRTYEV